MQWSRQDKEAACAGRSRVCASLDGQGRRRMRAWEAGDATVDSWGFFLEGLGAGKVCEPVQGRWCWPGTAIHCH